MLNRSLPPSFQKDFSFKLPSPEVISITDEVDFVFLNNLDQNVFKLEVVFGAGKWYEPKSGVSHFTAEMLDKGTSRKTSKEIAETLDYYGAQIEITPGPDFISASIYGLKSYLRETFEVFYEIITTPSFNEDEFTLQRKIFIQSLKINNEKNSFVASQLIRKNIFGTNHPYGNSIQESDVTNLTITQLEDYFRNNFLLSEIYLVGNLNHSDINWLTEKFKKFKTKKLIQNYSYNLTAGASFERIQKPKSLQASIRMGKRVINRSHEDFPSVILASHILGGYFGSRLMKNIREEKGLTYGISSSINPFRNDCLLSISTDTNIENLDVTVNEIKLELSRLQNDVVQSSELATSKNHFLGSLVSEISNQFLALSKIKTQRLNSLPLGYYESLFSAVKKCGAKEVQSAAQKYFNPSDLMVVTVG